jgi:hypothetical protein
VITASAEPEATHAVTASPNPAGDHVDVTCIGCAISDIRVVMATGLVSEVGTVHALHGETRRIDLSGLPAGLYYVRVTGHDFTKTIPVVKQ